MAYSPNGKLLATGEDTGAIRLWDVANGKELHSYARLNALDVAFSANGREVLTLDPQCLVRWSSLS